MTFQLLEILEKSSFEKLDSLADKKNRQPIPHNIGISEAPPYWLNMKWRFWREKFILEYEIIFHKHTGWAQDCGENSFQKIPLTL